MTRKSKQNQARPEVARLLLMMLLTLVGMRFLYLLAADNQAGAHYLISGGSFFVLSSVLYFLIRYLIAPKGDFVQFVVNILIVWIITGVGRMGLETSLMMAILLNAFFFIRPKSAPIFVAAVPAVLLIGIISWAFALPILPSVGWQGLEVWAPVAGRLFPVAILPLLFGLLLIVRMAGRQKLVYCWIGVNVLAGLALNDYLENFQSWLLVSLFTGLVLLVEPGLSPRREQGQVLFGIGAGILVPLFFFVGKVDPFITAMFIAQAVHFWLSSKK